MASGFSFDENVFSIASAPEIHGGPILSQATGFAFRAKAAPVLRGRPDVIAATDLRMLDGGYRTLIYGDDLRTLDLLVQAYLTPSDFANFKIFQAKKHHVALFPNYWPGDTCVLLHGEQTSAKLAFGWADPTDTGIAAIGSFGTTTGLCGSAYNPESGEAIRINRQLPKSGAVTLWFKKTSGPISAVGAVFQGGKNFWVGKDTGSDAFFFRYGPGVGDRIAGGYPSWNEGGWNQVAFSWRTNHATADTRYALTVNGISLDERISATDATFDSSYSIGFGRYGVAGKKYLSSAIDEVRIDNLYVDPDGLEKPYIRFKNEDEHGLQQLVQARYFRIRGESLGPMNAHEPSKYVGRIAVVPAFADPSNIVQSAGTWPTYL